MNILKVKKSITLLVGMIAITALGGIAQAETRFAVQDSTGTTDKMVVTDQGYVGIGGNSPIAALEIKGTTYPDSQIVTNYSGSTDNYAAGGFVSYRNQADGKLPLLNTRLGYFYFGAKDTTGPKYGGGLSAFADGNWTSTSTPGYFAFETTPNGSVNRAERMRITSSGNVGIGTTGPSQKLEIAGGLRVYPFTTKPTCSGTNGTKGTIWFTKGTIGTSADSLIICTMDINGSYAWRELSLGSIVP